MWALASKAKIDVVAVVVFALGAARQIEQSAYLHAGPPGLGSSSHFEGGGRAPPTWPLSVLGVGALGQSGEACVSPRQ